MGRRGRRPVRRCGENVWEFDGRAAGDGRPYGVYGKIFGNSLGRPEIQRCGVWAERVSGPYGEQIRGGGVAFLAFVYKKLIIFIIFLLDTLALLWYNQSHPK